MLTKFKSLFGAQDMTRGNPLPVMLKFLLPLLIGNIAQLLYSTADSIIVGKMLGANALFSVGASMPIQNLFFVFFMTVGSGVQVCVSQYYGAKDKERLSANVGTAILLALIATLTISAVGMPLARPILRATKVDASVFGWSHDYLLIMFAGAVGVGFYNILSGILRGMGNATFPLFVLLGTTVLNIGLDLLFVGPLQMEVAGAALATVISQTLSALVCLIRLAHMKDIVEITRKTLRIRADMVRQILRIGLPAGIMQGILSMSYVFVQGLINSVVVVNAAGMASMTIFGACNTAVTRVDAFANLPNQAFSMVGSTYAGQNIGAGRLDRVKKGFKIMLGVSLCTSAVLFGLIYLFGGNLMRMFIDMSQPDARQIIELGIHVQRIMIWCYLIMAVMQPANGVLRGAGDTLPVMWITIVCTVFMRVPMAYAMVTLSKSALYPSGNPDGIFWSMVICFTIAAAACLTYYLTGRWKKKAVVRAPRPAENKA
ncbi:MAG: MATE family efflux transporter [Oscillospiraceae bacterium]|nr:MATE family efflux transporter [Oscillospiraceae bacterium]